MDNVTVIFSQAACLSFAWLAVQSTETVNEVTGFEPALAA